MAVRSENPPTFAQVASDIKRVLENGMAKISADHLVEPALAAAQARDCPIARRGKGTGPAAHIRAMSLRLNKALGYALTDLVDNDPRINQDSPLLFCSRFEDEGFAVPTLDSYAAWLEEKAAAGDGGFGTRSEAKLLRNARSLRLHRLELTDAVVHQNESGPETLVLIPPVSLHRWCRADDAIDYIEASLLPGDTGRGNSLVALERGIGGYAGRFMDIDGTELNEHARHFIFFAGQGMPEDELDSIASRTKPADLTDDRYPYANAAEARERIVPLVPSDLRRLAEYGQLFTSDDVWKQLRPVLYTYWA
jgi:hypothetical protein